MNKILKKFFENELLGLKSILKEIQLKLDVTTYPKQEISKDNYPHLHEVIERISHDSGVYPKKVVLTNSFDHRNASCGKDAINIDLGVINNETNFSWTYTHELGHRKNNKFDSIVGKVNIPFRYLLTVTTILYTVGGMAYPFLNENKVLDAAKWVFNHTDKFLAIGALTNAVTIRLREHMADLFAFKYTGILPSKALEIGEEKRKGVIGNVSKAIDDVLKYAISGYPTRPERDFVCKILGKPKQTSSFVENIKNEREQANILRTNERT